MTNRDSANRGELAEVLVNLAFIYRPKASLADQFLCAAESLLREQERALAESRESAERWKDAAMVQGQAARVAEARAERLAEALKEYNLPLTGDDKRDEWEFGTDAVAREKRRRAALNLEPTP